MAKDETAATVDRLPSGLDNRTDHDMIGGIVVFRGRSMPRAILLLAFFLTATTHAQDTRVLPYPIFESSDWRQAVQNDTRTRTGRPGPNYWTNRAQYVIDATLDPASAEVRGKIRIIYHNESPIRLRSILIHLRQNLHAEGNRRLRPVEITGGMRIGSVTLNDQPMKHGYRGYSINGTVMRVRLKERLPQGDSVKIEMDFRFRVPKSGGAPRMGHEDHHVFYLGYWYPQVAVYDDVRGWVADQYLGAGEFYMGYADYEVNFTAPEQFIVRCTGELTNATEVLGTEQIARLEAARSTREVQSIVSAEHLETSSATRKSADEDGTGTLTWKFKATNVRDVAVSTSDRYLWDATYAMVRDDEGTERRAMIHAVYEENATAWKKAAEYARHAIEHTSNTLMPYPWPHMTVCEGVSGGGMEFPMMTIISVGNSPRQLYTVIAHELIHMWFPMIAGSNEKNWAWMDEGLTTFQTSFAEADYWKNDQSIRNTMIQYARTAGGDDDGYAIMRHSDEFPTASMAYFRAAYSKPAAVMLQLRNILGPERFGKALQDYLRDWAYKHPYPHDLFNTFSRVAETDLSWYFRIWMYETWTLDTAIAKVEDMKDATHVVIEDRGRAFHPTVVEVTHEDGSTETRVIDVKHWRTGARTKRLEFKPGVQRVRIDPDVKTLDKNRRNNRWRRRSSK